jgi:hypothetical protein
MLRAVGTKFYDGALIVKTRDGSEGLHGVNETMATTYKQGVKIGHYAQRYLNYNMNFPVYSGENTEIPASSDREFFWKYGWLLRYLGGEIQAMMTTAESPNTKVLVKRNVSLNHCRFGPHNRYGGVIQVKCFRQQRAYNDQMMKDLLDMMWANGIYITYTLGWSPGEGDGSGDVCIIGSAAYNDFVQYEVDYICAYHGHSALGMWDLFNEPASYGNIENYWKVKYGTEVEANGSPKWENKYLEFKDKLLTDVKAGVRARIVGDMPLITIGNGSPSVMWGVWDGHPQEKIDAELALSRRYNANLDCLTEHPYNSAEDDYLVNWNNITRTKLDKPLYYEEVGKNTSQSPWDVSYWSWRDMTQRKYLDSSCFMQLNGMAAIAAQNREEEVPYPGYPITPEVMASIPAMPQDVPPTPEPPPVPPPEPSVLEYDMEHEPYVQGSVIVPPAPIAISINVPVQYVKGKVTLFGRQWDCTFTIPATTILPNSITVLQQPVTISLPTIDLPPHKEK